MTSRRPSLFAGILEVPLTRPDVFRLCHKDDTFGSLVCTDAQTIDRKPTNVNRLRVGMQELIEHTRGRRLLSLCVNARGAMPARGKIAVETADR